MIETTDPATGEAIASYPFMREGELGEAVEGAAAAAAAWARDTTFAERAIVLRACAGRLRNDASRLAELMAREMGKPVVAGEGEIEKCAWVCEHYAEHAADYLADEAIETQHARSYVHHRPLGVVLAVMPWNFPFWQVFRFAAPALMAGNGALLKHAPNVTGCAVEIERLFAEAGAPADLFRTLRATHDDVAELIARDEVSAVTLTGSTRAGRTVAGHAGRALKKIVLELGGSDPFVVLEDADVARAAATGAASRLMNSGQSCIAAKRFLVVDEVHDQFVDALAAKLAEARMGSPLARATTLGPLARPDLREALVDQMRRTVDAGAEVVLGGSLPDGPGCFFAPTLLTGVKPGMAAFEEETFGPLASVIRVADEAEALALADRTVYGLGASVFTGNPERGERIARTGLRAGACFVNAMVASDPRLPFGGIRASGYGRELGADGIREFVNRKTVVVATE